MVLLLRRFAAGSNSCCIACLAVREPAIYDDALRAAAGLALQASRQRALVGSRLAAKTSSVSHSPTRQLRAYARCRVRSQSCLVCLRHRYRRDSVRSSSERSCSRASSSSLESLGNAMVMRGRGLADHRSSRSSGNRAPHSVRIRIRWDCGTVNGCCGRWLVERSAEMHTCESDLRNGRDQA